MKSLVNFLPGFMLNYIIKVNYYYFIYRNIFML